MYFLDFLQAITDMGVPSDFEFQLLGHQVFIFMDDESMPGGQTAQGFPG